MTTDESALLAAIEANPVADLPRLVYADWLEEHDQPIRAEFIRLQCEIDGLETDRRDEVRPHHRELWQRQADLLAHHRADILGMLAPLPGTIDKQFDRGFVSRMTMHVSDFLVYGFAFSTARPRPRIRVNQIAVNLSGFIHSSRLGCVSEIGVYAPGTEEAPWEWSVLDDAPSASRELTRLEVLDLEGCGIGDWFADLFASFTLPSLVELDLSNNYITDAGISDLLNCRLPRKLILGGNPISDRGAIEMAERLRDSPVEYLNLRRTHVGQDGHDALLNRWQRPGRKVDLF